MHKNKFSDLGLSDRYAEELNASAENKVDVKAGVSVSDKKATVHLYGAIGGYYGGVDAKSIIGSLRADKGSFDTIDMFINSPGGSVFDAVALKSALTQLKAEGKTINVIVDGVCASAATFFLGLGEVTAYDGTRIMIHNAWTLAIGNKDELKDTIKQLSSIDDDIANIYAEKSGKSLKDIQDKMQAETWLNAEEAKEFGLVDVYDKSANDDKEPANGATDDVQNALDVAQREMQVMKACSILQ